MKIDIITIFPEMFDSILNASILKRAVKKKKLKVKILNLRDFAKGKHTNVDDAPYGGGCGMVMKIEPVVAALKSIIGYKKAKKVIFSPAGSTFNQKRAVEFAKEKHIIMLCGHYEGYDERIVQFFDEEISIGDYVLTGGELPAMILIDCISRQIPGVLGKYESLEEERVSSSEVYTRPEILKYKGKKYRVPKVLLSGNHKKIEEWKIISKK